MKPVTFPSPRSKDWRPLTRRVSQGKLSLLRGEASPSVLPAPSAKSWLGPKRGLLRRERPQEERAGRYYCESEGQRSGSEGEAR